MRRMIELDAIRGIASVAILMFHLRFMRKYPTLGTAVDLFFVLSGYLITSILLKGDRSFAELKTFYARRAFRIWPIYYLTLVIFLGVNYLFSRGMPSEGWYLYAAYLQFIPDYWGGASPGFSRLWDHTWTLAIEEQFYIVWPLLVCLIGRKGVLRIAIPLFLMSVCLRLSGMPRNLLLARTDGLVLGGFLAALLSDAAWFERNRKTLKWTFASVGLTIALTPTVVQAIFGEVQVTRALNAVWPSLEWLTTYFALTIAKMSMIYFCVVGFIITSAGQPYLKPLRSKVLAYIGQISYGLYLYHPFLFVLTIKLREVIGIRGSSLYDVFRVACCFGLAAFSWRYVERPLLTLRDKLTESSVLTSEPLLKGPHAELTREASTQSAGGQ
ncbi:acyltransferase family protein [Singulisphaera sp. PoT]|uniref:acyltransferase family protein n=1 Tax=Singulisphaera sp. PoT TaxID=3411797 RepID=UPI003BF51D3F